MNTIFKIDIFKNNLLKFIKMYSLLHLVSTFIIISILRILYGYMTLHFRNVFKF